MWHPNNTSLGDRTRWPHPCSRENFWWKTWLDQKSKLTTLNSPHRCVGFLFLWLHPPLLRAAPSTIHHLSTSHLTPLISHRPSHSTHHATIYLTHGSQHSSHTARLTPLISHHSSHTAHLTPLFTHRSSPTTHHAPLISHHSSHSADLTPNS